MCCCRSAHTNVQTHAQNEQIVQLKKEKEKLKSFCIYIHIYISPSLWMHIYTYTCLCMWREGREEMGRRQGSGGEGEIIAGSGSVWAGHTCRFMLNGGSPDYIPYSVKSLRQTFSPWG